MSALSRLGPNLIKSTTWINQKRHMASASVAATDSIQKIFLEKIKEFRDSNVSLDEQHKKALEEDINRLKRIYRVQDDSKLTQLDHKFPSEHNVSLHDLEENREFRLAIASGEHQKQLAAKAAPKSALLASIPEPFEDEFHFPTSNKPALNVYYDNLGVPSPPEIVGTVPDYECVNEVMTPEKLMDEFNVKFGPDMPTIHDDKKPERDAVNYPRLKPLEDTPPSRGHFIPESLFLALYPKLGVTGPYTLGVGLFGFLLSKEWLVMEHELCSFFSMTIIFTYGVCKFGPKLSGYLMNERIKEKESWSAWQHGHINTLKELQEHYKKELNGADDIKEIHSARKQDVEIQLEAEYRRRLKTVYDDAKRRLDYLVATTDSHRQIAQRNMVNWVISKAISSVGPKQENEILDNCISNLKSMASKHANTL